MNGEVLTVSELNREARRLLEGRFPLLWVSGEVSNLVRAASGHFYFTLKDASAQVRCAMFRSRAHTLAWRLENGQQVEALSLVTLYEPRGEFQLNVEALRRAGLGRLYELYVKLREKLAAEGLFNPERKRPIPRFPRVVGIVTSPKAAALADVMSAFRRRAPHVELILYPTLVQGAEAPAAILAALEAAYTRAECELLLLVRGGGSLEDLWAFNDEAVVRKLAVSPVPTLSGVGHETDTTLVDLVADLRAPTPTAAAELASAGWVAAAAELNRLAKALSHAMRAVLETRMQALDRLALRLVHPAQRVASDRQRLAWLAHRLTASLARARDERRRALDRLGLRLAHARPAPALLRTRLDRSSERLRQAGRGTLQRLSESLQRAAAKLAALSPQATLERGYCIARTLEGAIVHEAAGLQPGERLALQFGRGKAEVAVVRTFNH
ncbi:MAG: exodeoxyribonuclease VII large subunit [Rhodocyclaceae bacterium]|nr:exodeoxyribonuclease VII large subunit [Rhodocyclaceae bacterium]